MNIIKRVVSRKQRVIIAVSLAVSLLGPFFICADQATGEEEMNPVRPISSGGGRSNGMKTDLKSLPKPAVTGTVSVEEVIAKRRSVRGYSKKKITTEQLSQLLWSVQGITSTAGFRTAPSAGALYPLEIYVADENGLFKYRPQGHRLLLVTQEDVRKDLADASWGQSFIAEAPVDIIICAVYEKVTSKYGNRGVRYTEIEVGHAAQNVHLQAVALGLDSVPVGAFTDEEVSRVLNLPVKEVPIYIIPVGYKK